MKVLLRTGGSSLNSALGPLSGAPWARAVSATAHQGSASAASRGRIEGRRIMEGSEGVPGREEAGSPSPQELRGTGHRTIPGSRTGKEEGGNGQLGPFPMEENPGLGSPEEDTRSTLLRTGMVRGSHTPWRILLHP